MVSSPQVETTLLKEKLAQMNFVCISRRWDVYINCCRPCALDTLAAAGAAGLQIWERW